MRSSIFFASVLLASTVAAAPADATTSDYTVVPIFPTSSSSFALSTVYVTTTIGVTSSSATTDSSSYSVVPIEGLPPATTVTVYKSGSALWTGTLSAPLGTGTEYPTANSTSPVVISSGASVERSSAAVIAGAVGLIMAMLW